MTTFFGVGGGGRGKITALKKIRKERAGLPDDLLTAAGAIC